MPVPFILAWYALKGWAGTALAFWRALPGPVKAAILIGLAGLVGELHGAYVERGRCTARIAASIKAAEVRDTEIATDAHARATGQAGAAAARGAADQAEVRAYVDEVAKRTAAACLAGGDADRYNDGLDVRDDAVQPTGPKPAPGPGHRAQPGGMPQGKGQ